MAFLSNRPSSLLFLLFLSLYVASIIGQGTVDPTKTIVWGSGLVSEPAGQPAVFYVQAVNTNGANMSYCDLNFGAFIYNTTNSSVPFDCNNGLFSFHYQQRIALTYTLRVTYNGVDVANSPYRPVVSPAPIYPPGSVGSGSGLQPGQVGVYSYFTVTDYDAYGNRNYTCNPENQWQARLTGAATIDGSIVNCTNGIWTLRYYATVSGNYDIRVSLNSVNLQNSPFHIFLVPGPLDASRLYPTGLGSTNATAGVYTYFYIVSVDQFGNAIQSCSAPSSNFNVYLRYGSTQVNATFQSCSNGLYRFGYNVTVSVSWQLFIFYTNILSGSSPSTISVAPSSIIEGEYSKATGIGLYNGTAGVPAPFNVLPYDIFGNQITFCPKSTNFTDWKVSVVSQSSGITCSGAVAGCTGGKFNGQYVCFIAATYSLVISYQGSRIQGSPFSPYVQPGPIDGHTSIAFGSGLSVAYAGVPATFVIDAFDQYSNDITKCLSPLNPTFDIQVNAADIGIKIKGNITSCIGGNYTGQYIITELSNLYILSINYQGNAVDESPYSITSISGPPYLPRCTATGQGLNSTIAGNTASFQVTCQDQYGNAVKTCYAQSYWSAYLTGPSTLNASLVSCNTNTGAATWLFQYLPYVSGQYNLIIGFTLSTGFLQFPPVVYPASFAPGNSIAVGPGVTSQNIPAGSTTIFYILSRDRYGNNVTNCIASTQLTISVKLASSGAQIPYTIQTCSQGKIPVTWQSTVAGAVVVSISYQGTPIEGSPYHPAVVAGPPTGRCHAAGGGLISATAGQPAYFVTSCSDPYGNPVYACYPLSLWIIRLTGPASLSGYVYSCSNSTGSYSATYTATKSGNYTINVSFQQTVVGGNPWYPIVSPGPLNDSNSLANGPGFNSGLSIVAGSSTNLTVTSYDSYQNRITTCTVPNYYWNVTLSFNNITVSTRTSSCYNGVYFASYSLQIAATYTVNVRGSYYSVQNNPGSITVIPGSISAVNTDFTALSYIVAGQKDPINIIGYDRFKNRITSCPPLGQLTNFYVIATLAQNPSVNFTGFVVSCSNGVIQGFIQINITGTYQLKVFYSSVPLISSPLPVYVSSGNVSLQYSYARGQGVDPSALIVAGKGATFYIDFYNQFGVKINDTNLCRPWLNWTVQFYPTISAYPSAKNATFGQCANGTLSVYYNATWAGYFTIYIYSRGQLIARNPYHSNVIPTYLDPTKTVVFGLNNTFNTYANFSIIARDIFGNSVVNASQSLFTVTIEPVCIKRSISCSPVGQQLLCKFWVWEGGRYCVTVYYQNSTVGLPDSDVLIYGGLACGYGSCQNGYCFAANVNSSNYVCNCFQGYSGSSCTSKSSEPELLIPAVDSQQPISKLSIGSTNDAKSAKSFFEILPKQLANDMASAVAGTILIISPIIGFLGYYAFDKLTQSRNRPVSA